MNSPDESGFRLNVALTRPDVVEWLRTIPEDKLATVVEMSLNRGMILARVSTPSPLKDTSCCHAEDLAAPLLRPFLAKELKKGETRDRRWLSNASGPGAPCCDEGQKSIRAKLCPGGDSGTL
jgi:hypothetical protein